MQTIISSQQKTIDLQKEQIKNMRYDLNKREDDYEYIIGEINWLKEQLADSSDKDDEEDDDDDDAGRKKDGGETKDGEGKMDDDDNGTDLGGAGTSGTNKEKDQGMEKIPEGN